MEFTAFTRYLQLVGDRVGETSSTRAEEQSSDYESGLVRIESDWWRLRTARVTPTKAGAFVAVWERDDDGATQRFNSNDPTVGLLVFVQELGRFGVFQFTSSHLEALGVTRLPAQAGKRGFRVYPRWSMELNPQARRTQEAQSSAFQTLEP